MAVHRIRNGLLINNVMLWEICKFYEREFLAAQRAVTLLNARFQVNLPEDEAGFIAMHFIDGQTDSAFDSSEQATIQRLGKEYFYDVKKVQLLNKLDAADERALERSEDFTPEEKSKLKDCILRFLSVLVNDKERGTCKSRFISSRIKSPAKNMSGKHREQ